ncbi:flagellar hook-associated protein FlgK [Halopseudomonas salina]|uniref:Flagellar hook-associated protein 1 n=1 Tax=Halopseudomonas salina TaxID=1323744 RepID=A0ABQ1P059_9GAMM|nr:flagellar hook-associated protein FlgK [Halopseudomonas salina]GGC87839.1 flagellar hook-associated protein FlgK [Halopseudomonas salina]
MADLFGIGLSGLKASQTNLSVTGQNISNVNTPGYSRQTAVQAARDPSFTGAGYIGNGTSIVDVQRVYNEFLSNQVRSSTAINSEVGAFQTQMEELNTLLSGTATGITPGLQNFFDALQTSVEDPASLPARQLFLSESEGLASRFNTVQTRLSTQTEFIGQQMGTLTGQVSRLSESIAQYNDSIGRAVANGSEPNDLFDARDEAVRQLSELIGVTVVPQDNNSINLFVGSGQPLVVGKEASSLQVVQGTADPSRAEVQLVSGGSAQGITSLISGGQLGGLIRYRQDVLDQALNSVGRLALSIADEVNSQLGQGLDVNGQAGGQLFKDINSPDQLDLRSQARPTNSDPNTKLNVFISDTSELSTSDYEVLFSSATQYSIRRVSDNAVTGPIDITAATAPEVDGFTITLPTGGSVAAGDRFLVTPTRYGSGGMESVMQQPEELGFAAPASADSSLANRGTAKITQPTLVEGPQPIDPAVMQNFLPIEMSYAQGSNTLTLSSAAGVITPTALSIVPGQTNTLEWEVDGYSFSMKMTGTPLDGDTFNINFNEGKSDNRNALALSELQTKAVLGQAGGRSGFSFVDGYGDLVQRVATFTAQARSDSDSSAAVLKQATNNRDSVSAVNLDEEAANLIKFEQYYNASAQVLQVARSLFDTLISSIR